MDTTIIQQLTGEFEDHAHEQDGVEFWYARDLQKLLDYDEWRNFTQVIKKAQTECENSGYEINDHFVGVNKMVQIGSGTEREVKDFMLTRYACYLIAQNPAPRGAKTRLLSRKHILRFKRASRRLSSKELKNSSDCGSAGNWLQTKPCFRS